MRNSDVPNGRSNREAGTLINIWIAKQKGNGQVKLFLGCQNKLKFYEMALQFFFPISCPALQHTGARPHFELLRIRDFVCVVGEAYVLVYMNI